MRMRNQGISKMEGVKTATIEPNGQVGYELKEDAKPLTVGEFKQLMNQHFQKLSALNQSMFSPDVPTQQGTSNNLNIFQEIYSQQQNPKYLQ